MTARPTSRAGAKAEVSDPTAIFTVIYYVEFLIGRLETPDKSYSGDNRLVLSERP